MRMTVGAAADAAGVSAKAVRLWEAKGLLPAAERTEAGYRVFTEHDLDVLRSDPAFKLACGRLPETGRDLMSQAAVRAFAVPTPPLAPLPLLCTRA